MSQKYLILLALSSCVSRSIDLGDSVNSSGNPFERFPEGSRVVFLSENTTQLTVGGLNFSIDHFNNACNEWAKIGDLPGKYLAFLGQRGLLETQFDLDPRLVVLPSGTVVSEVGFNFYEDLVHPIDETVVGIQVGTSEIWTGIDVGGVIPSEQDGGPGTCFEWTSSMGETYVGSSSNVHHWWTSVELFPCFGSARILCIQEL